MWFTQKHSTHYRRKPTSLLTSTSLSSSNTLSSSASSNTSAPLLPVTEIQGQKGRYQILYTITREEASAVLEQTGIEIPFGIGQDTIDYVIGSGAFGELRIGKDLANGQYVGIKIVHGTQEVEREAQLQATLTGLPHCMPSLDSVKVTSEAKTTLYQVMPLAGLGSGQALGEYLAKLEDNAFKEAILLHIAKGLLTGLAAMHDKHIYHLDIKPANLVVDQAGSVYWIDFGCARYSEDDFIDLTECNGDNRYFSPKRWLIWQGTLTGYLPIASVDSWAVGQTLWELATQTPLVDDRAWYGVLDQQQRHMALYPLVTEQLAQQPLLASPPSPFFALVKALLSPNPKDSVTASQALGHLALPTIAESHRRQPDNLLLGYLKEFVQDSRFATAVSKLKTPAPPIDPDNNNAPHPTLIGYQRNRPEANYVGVVPKPSSVTLAQPEKITTQALSPLRLPPAQRTGFIARPQLQDALRERVLGYYDYAQGIQLTACTGMGGVGKSQLALALIHDKAVVSHYGLCLWLTGANDTVQMTIHTIQLAQDLKLVEDKTTFEEAQMQLQLYLNLYYQRTGKPWLIIYDNADSLNQLKPYLPQQGGHVLVTSRDPHWPQAISVETMTDDEAITLLEKILQREEAKDLPLLAQTLGYLPLALAQAGAYIRVQGITVSDYLTLYQQQAAKQQLLQANHQLFGKALPHTMTTLLNIDTLTQAAPQALTCLIYCALLVPDNIPIRLIQAAFQATGIKTPKIAKQSLTVLVNQGLIKAQEATATVAIHRLVQEVVCAQCEAERLQLAITALIEALESEYDDETGGITVQEQRQRALIPFMERLGEHYSTYGTSTTWDPAWAGILDRLGLTYYGALGDAAKKKALLERALTIKEAHYTTDHPEVALTLTNLANAYGDLGDAAKKKALLERALAIFEPTYGLDHPQVALTLGNLAIAYGALGDATKQKELLERVLAIIEPTYGPDHPQVAKTLGNLANAYGDLGDAAKKKALLERTLAIFEPTYGPDHPQVAIALTSLANAYGDLGDPAKQKALLERVLAIQEPTYGPDHPQVAKTLGNLANAVGDLGDPAKKKELLEQVLAIFEPYYGPDHPEVAIALTSLANAYGDLGDPAKQKALLERVLTIFEPYYGPDHPSVAITLTNLANAVGVLGDPAKQKALLERALTIKETHYGPDHPQVAITLTNLANAHGALGDPAQKKALLERALTIEEEHYGPDHPQVAITLGNLVNAVGALGDPAKKKALLERVLAIIEPTYGPDHPQVAIALTSLANAYGVLGDPAKQKALVERALTIEEEHYGPDHPQVAITLGSLANAYGDLGDPAKKKALLERALTIEEEHYGPDHPEVAITLGNLANAYGALGDPAKQKALVERALTIKESYYGPDHPQVAITLTNLATAYGILGDAAKQKALLERVLTIQEPYYGPDHPQVAITLTNLAIAVGVLGDPAKEKELLERAYYNVVHFPGYGQQHPTAQHIAHLLITTLYQLAQAALENNQLQEAIDYYEQIIQLTPINQGAHHNVACYYHVQAIVQSNKELLQVVENHFQQALAIRHHSGICTEYANFLFAQQQYPEAITWLKQVISMSIKDDGRQLSYGLLEQVIVPEDVQKEITAQGTVTIKALLFAYYLLIMAYQRTNQIMLAKALLPEFQQAVEASSEALAYTLLGYTYQHLGFYRQAAESFQQALALKENYTLAQTNYEICLALAENQSKALALLQDDTCADGEKENDPINRVGALNLSGNYGIAAKAQPFSASRYYLWTHTEASSKGEETSDNNNSDPDNNNAKQYQM